MARFVLWGTYCDGALQKREPFRDEHLAGLRALKEQGTLITLGPTEGSTHVFAIFESDSKASVCALLEQDVYWREGIWTQLDADRRGGLSRNIPDDGRKDFNNLPRLRQILI